MRISDWSSDVCSSDLCRGHPARGRARPGCRPHGDGAGISLLAPQAAAPRRAAAALSLYRRCRPLRPGADLEDRTGGGTARPLQRRRLSDSSLRSEEHTSELQSLMRISYAVFCLNKKKHLNTNCITHVAK